ncbi:MAG: hypothetical protein ACT4N9_03000 [Paracoccaceae bacterium]
MKLVRDISVTSRAVRIGPAFSPARLFAAGEPGLWLDPSDLATLFQDSLGKTPVTADGQPVGLVLDKSKGLALGADLVTNGTFDGGTASWASGSSFTSTAAVVGGEMQVTPTADFGRQVQTLTLVVGRSYQITGTIRRVSGSSSNGAYVAVGFNTQGDSVVIVQSSSAVAASFSAVFVPTHATVNVCLSARTGNVGGFDNIVVKELAGHHSAQAISARRPTYRTEAGLHWLDFDGVDDLLLTTTLDLSATARLSLFAGVRKLSDAVRGAIVNQGAAGARSFALYGPGTGGVSNFAAVAGNTALVEAAVTSAAPVSAVLTASHDIGAAPAQSLAVNGGAPVLVSGGTGAATTFQNGALGIGGFATAERWFGGRLYGLVLRGVETSAFASGCAERHLAAKTGVSL